MHKGYSPSSRLAAAQNLWQRTPSLFMRWVLRATRDIRVLRSHDLPFPGTFEPCVGPDQTTLCLLAIFSLGDRAFGSIRYRDGVAEKSHLHLAQLAIARERFGICGGEGEIFRRRH